ncbi:ergothioneine biosynthesis protein EgtB [Flindersiella endophytica]
MNPLPNHIDRLVDGSAENAFKNYVADELERVRARSFALTTDVLDDPQLMAQHSRLMSPLVWDLAHVGNYEELWLLREAAGIEAMRPEIDTIYDAFEHPRSERPTLPLLDPKEATDYIGLVRRKVIDSLDNVRLTPGSGPNRALLDKGFVYRMVVQHEHMHDETMLATHQLRRGEPVFAHESPLPAPRAVTPGGPLLKPEVLVDAGPFVMGTSTDTWAFDNERPAYTIDLPAFWIDTTPVSVGAYIAFIEAGGYDDPRWWTTAGWEWRNQSGKRHPAYWIRESGQWLRRRFGRTETLPLDEPVQHVSYFEADAYARWAGKRLPTEAEWEKAASWDPATGTKRRFPWGDDDPNRNGTAQANLGQQRFGPSPVGSYPEGVSAYGVAQLIGDVWEWTSTSFTGHPGFCVFPYREYSEVFFGDDYKVLRGGSWATDPVAIRNTFRNWDYPIRRQIFTGFRCARDA